MLLTLTSSDGRCACGEILQLLTLTAISIADPLTARSIGELGLLAGDVITVRDGAQRTHLALKMEQL
jgi:hypothetical protein